MTTTNLWGINTTASVTPGSNSVSFPWGTNNTTAGGNANLKFSATDPGNSFVGAGSTTLAQTARQSFKWADFSIAIGAQTIPAQNWTVSLFASEGNAAANQFAGFAIYIWRSGTGKVATIYDTQAELGTEIPTSAAQQSIVVSGSSVTTLDGDYLVFEYWFTAAQSMATAYAINIQFGGNTTNTQFKVTFPNTLYLAGETPPSVEDGTVTDSNKAATDSVTATHIPLEDSTVTDSNKAATDSVTATHIPAEDATVTDSNKAATDTVTADHSATVTIDGVVTDSNKAATDSSTVTHTAPTIDGTVTDSNKAATDSSSVTHTAPTISGSVTDSNKAATDSSTVSQTIPSEDGVVTDSNKAATDSVTATHIFASPEDAVITDINKASIDIIFITHTAPLPDHQWDNKIVPVLNVTIVTHIYTGVQYKVIGIVRYNPRPPNIYRYTCTVFNLSNSKSGVADVWYDLLTSSWKCNNYDPVRYRDLDGVSKTL